MSLKPYGQNGSFSKPEPICRAFFEHSSLGNLVVEETIHGVSGLWMADFDECEKLRAEGFGALSRPARTAIEDLLEHRKIIELPKIDFSAVDSRFVERVLTATLSIPWGQTLSYGEVAQEIGLPGAARAVGSALGTNPIAILVPCHRVIGSTGELTGYGRGTDRLWQKEYLLGLEGHQFESFGKSATRRRIKHPGTKPDAGFDQCSLL